MASIDPEEFFEFQATRPQVRLVDGESDGFAGRRQRLRRGRDREPASMVLSSAPEAALQWRRLPEILEVVRELDVTQVITLGALLADVAHNRPVSLIGTGPTTASSSNATGSSGRATRVRPASPASSARRAAGKAWPPCRCRAAVPSLRRRGAVAQGHLALVQRASAVVGAPGTDRSPRDRRPAYEREIDQLRREDAARTCRLVARMRSCTPGAGERTEPISGERLVAEVERAPRARRTKADR